MLHLVLSVTVNFAQHIHVHVRFTHWSSLFGLNFSILAWLSVIWVNEILSLFKYVLQSHFVILWCSLGKWMNVFKNPARWICFWIMCFWTSSIIGHWIHEAGNQAFEYLCSKYFSTQVLLLMSDTMSVLELAVIHFCKNSNFMMFPQWKSYVMCCHVQGQWSSHLIIPNPCHYIS